jgi:hypothetical protein
MFDFIFSEGANPSYDASDRTVCWFLTLSDSMLDLARQCDFPVSLRCWKTSDMVFVAFVRPLCCRSLSGAFFLMYMDFSQ